MPVVWRIGDVEGFDSELDGGMFRDGEVLEEREVEVAEARSEQRIAPGVSNGSQGLRSEGSRIEELRQGLVSQARIRNRIWTINRTHS